MYITVCGWLLACFSLLGHLFYIFSAFEALDKNVLSSVTTSDQKKKKKTSVTTDCAKSI